VCRNSCDTKARVDPEGKAIVGDNVRLESSDPRELQKSPENVFQKSESGHSCSLSIHRLLPH